MEVGTGPMGDYALLMQRVTGGVDGMSALQKEEERRKAERDRAVLLLGLLGAAGVAGAGDESSGAGGASPAPLRTRQGPKAGGGGLGSALVALAPGGAKPGIVPALRKVMGGGDTPSIAEGGGAFGGGAPLRNTGMSNESAAKFFPMALMGTGAAAAGGGFLSSPVGGAATAAGIDLVGGLIGGDGGAEEAAKAQLRTQRQMNLFDGFREWNDRLARRNEEMRAVLASLGQS